jgi:hypothetical protein
MPAQYRTLSPEQLDALQRYAAKHGTQWKSQLNLAWIRAAEPGYLQQVRNQFGPSWLEKFSFDNPKTHRVKL